MRRTSTARSTNKALEPGARVPLTAPERSGPAPLEQCLATRRSCRAYGEAPLSLAHASQLLWAAQGVTGLGGLRTAPSARAIFPLRPYLIAPRVEGLSSGVYRYDPDEHQLEAWSMGDRRNRLVRAAFGQEWLYDAPAAIVLAAELSSMIREFGDRAERYTYFECGHVAQNICLQAGALGLGVITVGSFDPAEMKRLLELPDPQVGLYLVAIGPKP